MQKIREQIDPSAPYLPPYTGMFEETLQAGGHTRTVILYIPEGCRACTAGVIVAGDHGTTARELYEKSSWADLADTEESKEKLVLLFLEPEHGVWNLQQPENELAYIRAAYDRLACKSMFCVHESKFYMAGYGAGGTLVQMAAMDNPAVYAGIAAVSPAPVPRDYMEDVGAQLCTQLNGFQDPSGLGICKGEVPLPVWILADVAESYDYTPELSYWKHALGTEDLPVALYPDTFAYIRKAETPYPMDQEKDAYRLWFSRTDAPAASYGRLMNRRIWSLFFSGVRRWMGEPCGDLRTARRPVEDLHMEYHYQSVGGWMREWYVYIPQQVRPWQAVPLVFACHGFMCSGEIYAGNSQWHKAADRYGFIVIFPSAATIKMEFKEENQVISKGMMDLPAWNVFCDPKSPDELAFFTFMLNDVRKRWAVDMGRVFATGHSMGSMMTHFLGIAAPQLFAAIAPCSGALILGALEAFPKLEVFRRRSSVPLPVWMFGGEREEWLMPAVPEGKNLTAESIRLWCCLNGAAVPLQDFGGWTISGRWHDFCALEDPVQVRYTWVENFPHATNGEMTFRIWEEFFSRYYRGTDGAVHFL